MFHLTLFNLKVIKPGSHLSQESGIFSFWGMGMNIEQTKVWGKHWIAFTKVHNSLNHIGQKKPSPPILREV